MSVLGPLLFHSLFHLSVVSYPITVSYMIVMLMTLASMLLSLKTQSDLDRLTNCSVHLKHWFLAHDRLLNPTKSESSYFGTRQRLIDIFNLPTDINMKLFSRNCFSCFKNTLKLAYGNVETLTHVHRHCAYGPDPRFRGGGVHLEIRPPTPKP